MANKKSWRRIRLGEVVSIKHGWPFKSELFSEELTGKPIVVGIGNFEYTGGFRFDSTKIKEYRGEYPAEYELSPGDILLVMTCQTAGGEILGVPGKIPNDGRIYLHNQRMGKVVVKRPDQVISEYLYWLYLWQPFNRFLFDTASGTKILHTSPGRIESFEFDLPPLPIQRRIADILGALDDKIEVNRRISATLEAMAQALFKHWFVDFGPFQGGPFIETELGLVPEGWRVGRLGDIGVTIRNTIDPQKQDPDTPYISLADMPQGSVVLENWGKAATSSSAKNVMRRGQILFGKLRPYFRKVGISPLDGVCSTDILVIEPRIPELFSLVLCNLAMQDFIDYTASVSDGTRMPRVSWQMMAKYPIVIPPLEIVRQFNDFVKSWTDIIGNNWTFAKSLGG